MLSLARLAAPALRQLGGAAAVVPARSLAAGAPAQPKDESEDEEIYELLPPGCSLKDPTYGRSFDGRNSLSDPVLIYDHKPAEEYRPLKQRTPPPTAPLNVAAAQAALQESKDSKSAAAKAEGGPAGAAGGADEDVYVYLPPGSSMRDPAHGFPSSLSDPLDNRRVYYRDPNPAAAKK